MIDEIEVQKLRDAVETQYVCTATFAECTPVTERFERKKVWKGVVYVFDITGHPRATKAYAWSSPIDGSNKRRVIALLHQPPVTSPEEAVVEAVFAEQKQRQAKSNE
jgi:hypothetical protein